MNWFTKEKFGLFSFSMMFFYIISLNYKVLNLPASYIKFCCLDDRKLNLFLIAVPLFVFTFIVFFTKQSSFNFWKKFTFIYLFIYLVLYFSVSTQGDGYFWMQRETISFFGAILYSIISLFLILYHSLKK